MIGSGEFRTQLPALIILMSLAAGTFIPSALDAAPLYHATDLGDLPGAPEHPRTFGNAINNYGQVVGVSYTHAFLWTPDSPNGDAGSMTELAWLAEAMGINDFGQVTGRSWGSDFPRVFLWTPTQPNGAQGTVVEPGTPPGYWPNAIAVINDSGQVAETNYSDTYLWNPATPNDSVGTMTALAAPMITSAAMNAYGQVAGYAGYSSGAALFTPDAPNASTGTVTVLPIPAGAVGTSALGMNNGGQVVGYATELLRAFLWTPDSPNGTSGAMALLPGLVGSSSNERANDINNRGEIVGYDSDRAAIWTEDGVFDLNTVLDQALPAGWWLDEAVAINDIGQIVATGIYDDGIMKPTFHPFLLTPVPEPNLLFLLVLPWCLRRHRHPRHSLLVSPPLAQRR